MKKILIFSLILLLPFAFFSCKTLQNFSNAISNLQKVKFKLGNVNNFRLAGITLDNKNKISNFSVSDGLKLAGAYRSDYFPAEFILNVEAKNPNDGSGKTKTADAKLRDMEWRLFIDGVETVSGNLPQPVTIPGTGRSTTIPLRIKLDLFKFFADRGYEGIVNLALALGGADGSAAKLKLDAKPTIDTEIGAITYPGRITIVDGEFKG